MFFSDRRLGLLLWAAGAVVVLLLLQTQRLDEAEHRAWERDLLRTQALESQLDRDTLRVANLRLVQYDPLVASTRRLRELEQGFRNPALERYGHLSPTVDAAIDAYWETIAAKQALVERIKFQAALVRNGLNYLPRAIDELRASGDPLAEPASALLNQLYLFNLFPSATEQDAIQLAFDTLAAQAGADRPVDSPLANILLHMRANLTGLVKLDQLRNQYLAVPSAMWFSRLQTAHANAYSAGAEQTKSFGRLLALATLLLLVALALVLRRFERAHRQAERDRRRLVDAVESLDEGFALFDADDRLVLGNRRFSQLYPWLEKHLAPGIERQQLDLANRSRSERWPLQRTAAAESPIGATSFLERLDDGRWILASDTRTREHGVACVRIDVTETKQREQELRKLSQAVEQSPAAVMITDTRGRIEYVNPRFEQVSGYSAAEAIGNNPRLLKSGETSPEEYRALWQTLAAGRTWRGQFHNRRKDGAIYWESASISPLRDDSGQITHYIAVKEDISARKRAEEQLRLNATVFETTTEGIMVTDAENRIKTVNPAFTRITGYLEAEVIDKDPRLLSSGRHDAAFFAHMWDRLLRHGAWSGEIWNRRKDGTVFPTWMSLATIRNEQGQPAEFVSVFSDITQRKSDEEQIRYQANYDALTGLPNRTLLRDRLEQSLAAAHREEREIALLFVDLDRFKLVNDSLGHVAGDALLQQVAERMLALLRKSDTLARFGGDEFVVLLPEVVAGSGVVRVAEEIIAELTRPIQLAGRDCFIGASVGIALYPSDGSDADALLRHADMAMYRAKEAGRNRYQFFTPGMQHAIRAKAELEQELRLALDRDQLVLYYQPQVEARTGRLVACEALIRWQHPTLGLIAPDQFVPLAEESGLIDPIGRWVLQTACHQLRQWRDQLCSGLRMAVNVSPRQRQLGLEAKDLEAILSAAGLDGSALVLEITESLMLDSSDAPLAWLSRCRDLGMRLSIDDFGTGYSSLSYLKRFQVDEIKIDRSFIAGLPERRDDLSLVETIIAMANNLGMELVAEGVENDLQRVWLREHGCQLLQGYLFGHPQPAEQAALTLARLAGGLGTTDRVHAKPIAEDVNTLHG